MVVAGHRSSSLNFCLARAAQARAEAEAATLTHVRERCLRSADAWTAIAERAEQSEKVKAAEAKKKAAPGSTS